METTFQALADPTRRAIFERLSRHGEQTVRILTDAAGVSSLVAGDYMVQADEDSLPAGYSADTLGEPQKVTVGASSPGKAAWKLPSRRAASSVCARATRHLTWWWVRTARTTASASS